MYAARTATTYLLDNKEQRKQVSTDKPIKNVRFGFDVVDKNFEMTPEQFKKLELEKKKAIAISTMDWLYLFWLKFFGCPLKMSVRRHGKRNNRLKKLQIKGE